MHMSKVYVCFGSTTSTGSNPGDPMPSDADALPRELAELAAMLDASDPLAAYRDEFILPEGVVAYLDGNSLGRPLKATRERLVRLVDHEWGKRLIRAWDESW